MGISSEALKSSSWAIGPSILRATDWPLKLNQCVIKKIRLKGPIVMSINAWSQNFSFSPISHSSKIPNTGSTEKSLNPVRGLKGSPHSC